MEGMNQFGIQYIYTWQCHNETPCIAILNKQKSLLFSKTEVSKVRQFLFGGRYQWEGEGNKKRVQEGEYGRSNYVLMYQNRKMKPKNWEKGG
jgi:hypothetical protein